MSVQCHHDHDQCIRDALDQAERICARRGARLTPVRRRVLEEIWQDHEAIKAYEILDRLSAEGQTVKPPTVYRALEFLLDQGLIHRVESLNAFVGCGRPHEQHDFQLFICQSCGHIEEFDQPDIGRLIAREADQRDFAIGQQTIEVKGLCARCRNGAPTRTDQ